MEAPLPKETESRGGGWGTGGRTNKPKGRNEREEGKDEGKDEPFNANHPPIPQLQPNTKLRPLRYLVEPHLRKEVIDTRYGDRFGDGGCFSFSFFFDIVGRGEEDGLYAMMSDTGSWNENGGEDAQHKTY
jgi:hypothetical protein